MKLSDFEINFFNHIQNTFNNLKLFFLMHKIKN